MEARRTVGGEKRRANCGKAAIEFMRPGCVEVDALSDRIQSTALQGSDPLHDLQRQIHGLHACANMERVIHLALLLSIHHQVL